MKGRGSDTYERPFHSGVLCMRIRLSPDTLSCGDQTPGASHALNTPNPSAHSVPLIPYALQQIGLSYPSIIPDPCALPMRVTGMAIVPHACW